VWLLVSRRQGREVKRRGAGGTGPFSSFIHLLIKPSSFLLHTTHTHSPSSLATHSLSLMASLQSPLISPVPQLVNATTPNSVNKNLLFVDFVGLYCKSKRTRRKIGVSSSFSSSFSRFANKKKSSCPVNATLSVDRRNISPPSSPSHPPPDLKPQVCFCLLIRFTF
jgi:hypothetical protein